MFSFLAEHSLFRRAPFTFNLCSALCVFLVKFWFELTYRQTAWLTSGGAGSVGQGSSPCFDAFLAVTFAHGGRSLVVSVTKNRRPSFQTQIYSCPTRIWFMSCGCCALQTRLWWEVRSREHGQRCVFKSCSPLIFTVSFLALSTFFIWGS